MPSLRTSLFVFVASVLIAPAASAAALYRCTMTGDVHVGRCCGEHESHRQPEIAPEDCCQLVTQRERDPSPSADAPRASVVAAVAAPLVATAPAAAVPQEIQARSRFAVSRAPPRAVWLVTCAMLL